MNHIFDVEEAEMFGVNAAILLTNIRFWVAKNKANDINFKNGRYWTFNSARAFKELHPYMTKRQIEYALLKLVKFKVIKRGRFNKKMYDKTSWYTIT